MGQENYLIVTQQSPPPENLQEVLTSLAREYGLDAYNCRQRLVGQGLSLLHKGGRDDLELISPLLHSANIHHWLIEPTKPQFAPAIIRSLQQDSEGITFTCQKKQVRFEKGAPVLAVLADLSGQLAERSVKQLLASHAYQGIDNISHITEEKTYKTILQGKPVLDLYLLDSQNQIVDAVRVLPGKFDHTGLGERATASSRQNLHQMLELSRENADEFQLETSFGLVNLPNCTLRKPIGEDPDTLRKNLISLVHYGWLMADLRKQEDVPTKEKEDNELTGAVTAAILAQNPALAGSAELAEAMPIVGEIAAEIRKASAEDDLKTDQPQKPHTRALPAPPPPQTGRHWRTPRFWFGSIGGFVGIAVTFMLQHSDALPSLAHYGFRLGIIPALFAALMFWGGFYFLNLKRQIENTPTSKIRSVAMGMVEVKGKAIRQYALISPMTHAACAWYRLTKYRRDNNRNWVISSITSSGNVPFLLEDKTGRICVDPAGAMVKAKSKQEGSPGQSSLLYGSGFIDNDSSEKWVEELVFEGTILYVLGFAAVKKEKKSNLRDRKVEALRELKRDPEAMKKFDADGDGNISETEWEEARAAVEDQVLKESLAGRDRRRKQEEQIVIKKPTGGRPFIVAETHSEAHLTGRFVRYIIPLFVGAALCTGGAISLLVKWLT